MYDCIIQNVSLLARLHDLFICIQGTEARNGLVKSPLISMCKCADFLKFKFVSNPRPSLRISYPGSHTFPLSPVNKQTPYLTMSY